ncbi:MAG TPA: ABC transporter permease [Gemmatimonadaceae bacterium]|nr:ABC transporter permease [Gemmatimonadaceae bacterium]
MDSLRRDLLFAVRQLTRARSFTLAAIGTLGIGIGATVAVFSIVEAVVFRPFPFTTPDRVVDLHPARNGVPIAVASNLEFATWRALPRAFDGVAAISGQSSFTLARGDAPEVVNGVRATAGLAHVLGVSPELGRSFSPEDDRPGAPHVVILGHRLWVRDFNGNRTILGQHIRLDGDSYEVIGVMPASIDAVTGNNDLWAPLALSSTDLLDFHARSLQIVARLAPGTSMAQATAAVDASERALATQYQMWGNGYSGQVRRFSDDVVDAFRPRLLILLGAVSFVFLIACVNVANLLLARGSTRARELGIRTALGAKRTELIRQLLTESTVLAVVSGAIGVGLAFALVPGLIAASPPGVPRLSSAHIDAPVLAVALLAATIGSLLVGVFPALRVTAREGARAATDSRARGRARNVLVTAEVALAMALLTGAGLLIRTAWELSHVDPGFDSSHVLTAQVVLPPARYTDLSSAVVAYRAIRDGVTRTPGVQAAALTSTLPLGGAIRAGIGAEGQPYVDGERLIADVRIVTPGYFATMRIRMRDGRDIATTDDAHSPKITVINEALARKLWHGERAVGKRMEGMDPSHTHFMTVIGVIADIRDVGLEQQATPEFYIPVEQTPAPLWAGLGGALTIIARGQGTPELMERPIRGAVSGVDPSLPVAQVATMDAQVRTTRATARFNTMLLCALGAIALVLASVGVYGVIAYSVAQRTREIGLRMALGATPSAIGTLVVRQGLAPIALGAVIGGALSVATTRLLRDQLYGVGPGDPTTIVAIAVLLLIVSLVAACIPTRRAMSISPVTALTV